MAGKSSNVVDSWEEINEEEMFEQSQGVSERKESTPVFRGPIILQGEDSVRSQYLPPEPSVKILKRPSREERLNAAGVNMCNGGGKPVKTLRQREAEYAEARQRIMGDQSNDLFADDGSERIDSTPQTSPAVYTLLRPPVDCPRGIPYNVVRSPRGPDGTSGFSLKR